MLYHYKTIWKRRSIVSLSSNLKTPEYYIIRQIPIIGTLYLYNNLKTPEHCIIIWKHLNIVSLYKHLKKHRNILSLNNNLKNTATLYHYITNVKTKHRTLYFFLAKLEKLQNIISLCQLKNVWTLYHSSNLKPPKYFHFMSNSNTGTLYLNNLSFNWTSGVHDPYNTTTIYYLLE